jgi:hypothetical protein
VEPQGFEELNDKKEQTDKEENMKENKTCRRAQIKYEKRMKKTQTKGTCVSFKSILIRKK